MSHLVDPGTGAAVPKGTSGVEAGGLWCPPGRTRPFTASG